MRPFAFIGLVATAIALGTLAIGQLVVLPALESQPGLLDANLAKALAGPLHLRQSEIVLAACLVLTAALPRWIGSKSMTTVGLLAIAAAATQRFYVLPALYTAYGRADLVAARPVDRILEAQHFQHFDYALSAAIAAILVGVIAALTWKRGASSTPQPA